MSESNQQHEGERGNAVDQVADLLMADEPAVDEEFKSEEAVHRPNDDDLLDDSEQSEGIDAQEFDDEVEDLDTDDSNEQETDDDDGLASLAEELGLEADKLTLSEDGDILINLKVNGKTEQVDLKEAIAGTQFHKANDEKARLLADDRKSFESERAEVAQGYAQQLQQIRGLGEMLQSKLTAEFRNIDWDRLRATDPAEWTAKQREFEIRNQELHQAGQMLGQQMRVEQDRESQQESQFRQQTVHVERERMLENNPSMLYDQGKTVASKKVKQSPKVQRASNGRFVKGGKNGKVNKLIERAQKAKGANKRDAQADAVAALLMGE